MGMTDLRFKSYLKQLVRAIETAEKPGHQGGDPPGAGEAEKGFGRGYQELSTPCGGAAE